MDLSPKRRKLSTELSTEAVPDFGVIPMHVLYEYVFVHLPFSVYVGERIVLSVGIPARQPDSACIDYAYGNKRGPFWDAQKRRTACQAWVSRAASSTRWTYKAAWSTNTRLDPADLGWKCPMIEHPVRIHSSLAAFLVPNLVSALFGYHKDDPYRRTYLIYRDATYASARELPAAGSEFLRCMIPLSAFAKASSVTVSVPFTSQPATGNPVSVRICGILRNQPSVAIRGSGEVLNALFASPLRFSDLSNLSVSLSERYHSAQVLSSLETVSGLVLRAKLRGVKQLHNFRFDVSIISRVLPKSTANRNAKRSDCYVRRTKAKVQHFPSSRWIS